MLFCLETFLEEILLEVSCSYVLKICVYVYIYYNLRTILLGVSCSYVLKIYVYVYIYYIYVYNCGILSFP